MSSSYATLSRLACCEIDSGRPLPRHCQWADAVVFRLRNQRTGNSAWGNIVEIRIAVCMCRAAIGLVLTGCLLVGSACGGRQTPKTDMEDANSWRNRGLWVEKQGDQSFVMAVGVAPNASMGRNFAMPNAEGDARAKLSQYLGTVVKTFRERLARLDMAVGKARDGEVTTSAESTQRNDIADRSVSDNVVQGMETLNSYVDDKSDELYVLARVDAEQLRQSLSASQALSDAERAKVAENSAEVRSAFDEALRGELAPR